MRWVLLAALAATACAETAAPDPGETPSFGHDINNVIGGVDATTRLEPLPFSLITYYLEPVPEGLLDPELYEAEVVAAFDEWTRASGGQVTFGRQMSAETAHIVIGFRSPNHQDQCDAGFRRRKTLGHAFTWANGCLAGVIHLNNSIRWVLNGSNRHGEYDVRTVVLHEIGHLLGLGHSGRDEHVMSAAYPGVIRRLDSHESEDVRAVLGAREE